jgi:signal transduction histidine kinase
VKKKIEAHHGWGNVEREVGIGSVFSFSLPKQIEINSTNLPL